jgi:hypothetical protein
MSAFGGKADMRGRGALLKRMLAAGISRWHPDPMAAIAEAKNARPVTVIVK